MVTFEVNRRPYCLVLSEHHHEEVNEMNKNSIGDKKLRFVFLFPIKFSCPIEIFPFHRVPNNNAYSELKISCLFQYKYYHMVINGINKTSIADKNSNSWVFLRFNFLSPIDPFSTDRLPFGSADSELRNRFSCPQ